MPADQMPVPLGDALAQLACRLLAEARSQSPQKLPDRPMGSLDDDVGTNLLAWLLDAYDDAFAEDSGN